MTGTDTDQTSGDRQGARPFVRALRRLSRPARGTGRALAVVPVLGVAVAFAAVFVLFSGALRPIGRGEGAGPSAASPSAVSATPSDVVPTSGPTPTTQTGQGGPVATPAGTTPYRVVAVSVDPQNPPPDMPGPCDSPHDNSRIASAADFFFISPPPPLTLMGTIFVVGDEPTFQVTYRWRFSDGQVSTPKTDTFSVQNSTVKRFLATYQQPVSAADADGRKLSAQLEVLAPTPMLSQPMSFRYPLCAGGYYGSYVRVLSSAGQPIDHTPFYDCNGPNAQTFTVQGIMTFSEGTSVTISYHWARFDGSTSPTYAATSGGAAAVDLIPDKMVVTRAAPQTFPGGPGSQTIQDTLVIGVAGGVVYSNPTPPFTKAC